MDFQGFGFLPLDNIILIVAIVFGLVQVGKQPIPERARWLIPLLAVSVAVGVVSLYSDAFSLGLKRSQVLLEGMLVGLVDILIYEGGKRLGGGDKVDPLTGQ